MNEIENNIELDKPKKDGNDTYSVYVKDPKTGIVKKISFKEPSKKTSKKSFRARKNCDTAKDKTSPRYWSCKFWNENSISDILNEIVQPDSIEVGQLSMKDELCPMIWSGEKMKPDVRKILLKNVIEFIKFCKIENLSFKDIILTGSLANYNYSDTSDLDVHILMNFNQISTDKEFISEYFKTKKNFWIEKYGTVVKSHDVEIYVQDTSEDHISSGVYSLINDSWLSKPIKKMVAIDTTNIQLKSADLMNSIDDLLDNDNGIEIVNKVDSLMEKLKKLRASGLKKEGEFSTENLVFKVLRNNGYLEKLSNIKKNSIQKELSLEGINLHEGKLDEADFKGIIDKAKKVGLLSLGMVVGLLATNISTQQLRDAGIPQELLIKANKFINDVGHDFLGFQKSNTNINKNIQQ